MHHPQAVADWLRSRVQGDLQCDSRRVQPGDGFVAWPGAATDGRRFVATALQAGAAAVLVEQQGVEAFAWSDERVLAVPGLKAMAGPIASAYYGDPSSRLDVIAITGTNGKTSTAWWLGQLLSAAGQPCAVVGTLGIGQPPLSGDTGHALVPTGLTTPDPVLLQARLSGMANAGLRACAIEASSIGLVEGRLNACRMRVAVFTNFTQDHLDFHGSMDRYWSAKAALFDWPGLVSAVVNLDDPRGSPLAATLSVRGLDVWTVGIEDAAQASSARLFAQDLGLSDCGMRLVVGERNGAGDVVGLYPLNLPLVGRYNVSNLLCVLAVARTQGVALADAVQACTALSPVPGRMEQVPSTAPGQPLVLVDYAHTPDALEKALQALQPLAQQRGGALWAVVGCGGDRDASKRPLMAAVAERGAQHTVLTSDNPRSEDPLDILAQMQTGLTQPDTAHTEPDRAGAIAWAVHNAQAADVVLIAGKGHEDYQEVMGVKKPFSDRAKAQAALQQRAATPGASV
ncbi:MAG: UDP-N-acetylmuramoyl-L-alanyl-D-glutamate--2,6-diaminopimelate ligase [Hydrogenophaga sp.]|uniref:UDP-N-acetylmuramoyl-L-alanyl-D-glutamate--2, 6-diaminopimelate ligase n=1 Tax=Hydrogenophaga sp. TaxID=1904254 RepID=UPI002769213F|nr:UDP-N-acetylmuramoyl-L-alanyl-D-glutamate--2,6-diaminopimelate ligase [Hydrogenophaga sp.]MDP2416627.1 UDP-N-acetylmuramoyl-L-alanyl-D-glutamate--2,6-diaminopimelate ligase [Hydrogenophaga sp.]MDZ4189645.1 UDP-N-acetylmuramoyl-L-alanyl-D-glutamate--2,6-diaminopimelate ligase [Hydrogenophaga sp.]